MNLVCDSEIQTMLIQTWIMNSISSLVLVLIVLSPGKQTSTIYLIKSIIYKYWNK